MLSARDVFSPCLISGGTKDQLSREVASALTFEWGSLWNIH